MNKFDALYSKIKRGLVTEAYDGPTNPPGTSDPDPFDGDLFLEGEGGVKYFLSIGCTAASRSVEKVDKIYTDATKIDQNAKTATLSTTAEDKLIEMGLPAYSAEDPEFPAKYEAWAKTADPAKLDAILSEDGIFEQL